MPDVNRVKRAAKKSQSHRLNALFTIAEASHNREHTRRR
jgi:hypothetical protein